MPSADVLAVLAQREVVIPDAEETTEEDKSSDADQKGQCGNPQHHLYLFTDATPVNSCEEPPNKEECIASLQPAAQEPSGFKAPALPQSSPNKPDPVPPKKIPSSKTAPSFSYREPVWTSICEEESYKLEVLKNGKIIGKVSSDFKMKDNFIS